MKTSIIKEIGKKVNVNITVLEATRINIISKSPNSVYVVAEIENKEMRSQPIRTSKTKKLNANMLVNNWPIESKAFIN